MSLVSMKARITLPSFAVVNLSACLSNIRFLVAPSSGYHHDESEKALKHVQTAVDILLIE